MPSLDLSSSKCLRISIIPNIYPQGWGLLSQYPPFRYFPHFPLLSKQTLAVEYHVYIWQVSPQLSCGDTCQIWMWFEESNRYFCKIENFAYGEISKRSFSNPHPWSDLTWSLIWYHSKLMAGGITTSGDFFPVLERWLCFNFKLTSYVLSCFGRNTFAFFLIIYVHRDAAFVMEDEGVGWGGEGVRAFTPHSQCHGCWWSGNASRGQGIDNHRIASVHQVPLLLTSINFNLIMDK